MLHGNWPSSIAQGDHQPLFKTMTRSTNLSCCQLHRIAHMISSSIVNQFEVSTRGILDSYLKYLFLVLCTGRGEHRWALFDPLDILFPFLDALSLSSMFASNGQHQ